MPVLHFCSVNNAFFTPFIYFYLAKTQFFKPNFSLFCRIIFIIYLFPYMNGAPMSELPMVLLVGVLFDVQALAYFQLPFHLLSLFPSQKYFRKKKIFKLFSSFSVLQA